MSAELLAIVEVDKADRVACQAEGCGHGVYKRIHVVRHDGKVGVYGSDCFDKLFGSRMPNAKPRYGGGDGRELTPDERLMLVESTERLLAQWAKSWLRRCGRVEAFAQVRQSGIA